jgi:hypothetical protein
MFRNLDSTWNDRRKHLMILGMSTATYTLIHVIISLIGIVSGLFVLAGLLAGKFLRLVNGLFLITTLLTSLGGFAFPNSHITPAIVLGILSCAVLAIAIAALYIFHLAGHWRTTYVVTAMIALYFNCFVLVVQLFLKVPAIHALAPTQAEPPFKIAQATLLILFIVLTAVAAKKFRSASLIAIEPV